MLSGLADEKATKELKSWCVFANRERSATRFGGRLSDASRCRRTDDLEGLHEITLPDELPAQFPREVGILVVPAIAIAWLRNS